MPLRLGNNSEPSALYHGSDPVSRVYLGSQQVWPSTPQNDIDLSFTVYNKRLSVLIDDASTVQATILTQPYMLHF